eukprot:comp7506_c0_seq1/m.3167 comp7506_c0_seq1/g.3167  ORF comp7506_c0_seq1/g.3167 comp7506_c0_seq1/m.3167 type:complete len:162 (-) comp7506_c0_seq1:160-645(-)
MDHSGHGAHAHAQHASDAAAGQSVESGGVHMMMQMAFSSKLPVTILFEHWTVATDQEYYVSWLAIFATSVFWMWLRGFRQDFEATWAIRKTGKTPLQLLTHQGVRGGLFALELALSYVLMLVAMTFNVGLFWAVVGGATVGFVAFERQQHSGRAVPAGGCH